ncbi:hypothetical protein HQ36_04025 [Porphyromonas gingivicanis]|uniref:Outer membrane protein beta-barrel domain-containing protein n=1 Tax=Porphyromonas gingivicanis TaxID=266762 RepID=A0A0A2G6S9_9PORP|nr:porin family protein [Porphyromonas gingivicanis]KGN98090.1 hypothetical protein HQ36_04025 [Porphyromonas gingivicanis]
MLYKKVILCLLLCLPSLLWGQRSERTPTLTHPTLYVGASAGASASQLLFMPSVSQTLLQGIRVGFMATLANSEYTDFTFEVAYNQRGWQESRAQGTDKERFYLRKMNFIDFPILCHLYYPIRRAKVGIKMGPQIGLFLGETITSKGTSFTPQERVRQSLKVVNTFAWGLMGGPSISYSWGRHRIEMDILVYYGFNDIFSTTIRDPYSKSSELFGMLKLNYLFRLL